MFVSKYEIVLKVAEMKNFTKVADYYQYTQSAISQTIKAVEKEIGFKLFHRTPKCMYLSEEGKAVLPAMQEIILGKRHLEETISEIHHLNHGVIRFGSYNSLSIHWLPNQIKAFQEIYPQITFEYYQGDDTYMLNLIENGTVDIVFMCNPEKKNLKFQKLFDDPFVLVLPQDHPLADEDLVTLDDLEDEIFLLQNLGYKQYMDEIFQFCNYKPKTKYNMVDDISIIAMVEDGLGISILPELMTRKLSFNVKGVPLFPHCNRTLGLITRKNNNLSWAIREFIDFIFSDPCESTLDLKM